MTEVEIYVKASSTKDVWARYHGLSIDSPLNADFWSSQPDKVIGVSPYGSPRFEYRKTFDLADGSHYLVYGNSSSKGYEWSAEVYVDGKLAGKSDNIYRGSFLRVDFTVGAVPPPPTAPAGIPWYLIAGLIGGVGVISVAGVMIYNEYAKVK